MPDPTRLGFHYFPDTLHYRQIDLETWLPELHLLGAKWLVLLAPLERAIPEPFVKGLLQAGVQPVLHFDLPLHSPIDLEGLRILFRVYAEWGVRHVVLFDRPNLRSAWTTAAWMQPDLVERFLDVYLPVAELALSHGVAPVFPPLQPGGDYWDLAFLGMALRSLKRRLAAQQPHSSLLERLCLAAYAGSADRPIDWGAGGPDRWPGARPYSLSGVSTLPGIQDQRGLFIHEWYLSVCQQQLGAVLPIFLLGAGSYPGDAPPHREEARPPDWTLDETQQARRNLDLLGRVLAADFPAQVQAACFWLLAEDRAGRQPETASGQAGWFQVDKEGIRRSQIVDQARRWINLGRQPELPSVPAPATASHKTIPEHPISHYILLPLYSWGAAGWDMALIAPLLQQGHPTVGFSLEEARLAGRVTVVGGSGAFSAESLDFLRTAGCAVDCLGGE